MAADLALSHRLAFTDAVIYASARKYNVELVTSDDPFEGLPGVTYFPERTHKRAMDKTATFKTSAAKAQWDFITAVARRAAKFGITAKGVSPVSEEGQLIVIEGQPYPIRSGGIYGGSSHI